MYEIVELSPTETLRDSVHGSALVSDWEGSSRAGDGGGVPSHFYLFHKGDLWKAIFFSPQDRLYFHQALWPFIFLLIFPTKIFISSRPLKFYIATGSRTNLFCEVYCPCFPTKMLVYKTEFAGVVADH